MTLGKTIHMRRLFAQPSGRILVVALDHPIAWGVVPGIERISETLERVIDGNPDAVTLMKGTAERSFLPFAAKVPFILKCTSFSPFHQAYDAQLAWIDEAVRLGADAVAVGATVGGKDQPELLRTLAAAVREASLYGMPVVTHIYPKGEAIPESERYSVENVCYAARAAAELGVDVIKTYYTGSSETFRRVVECTDAKVVVSGGPKLPTLKDVFQMTYDAVRAGAAGVVYGRNVWQADDPAALIRALASILHHGATVPDALEMMEKAASEPTL